MESSILNKIEDEKINEFIYEKLLEAELEMSKTDKRYTADEVFESLNKIISNNNE